MRTIQHKPPVTIPNPYDKYGSGAESKMRLAEGAKDNANAVYREKPLSEARMRSQEQPRYVPPPDQSSVRSQEFERRHIKARVATTAAHTIQAAAVQPAIAKPVPKNPFDDDDDTAADDYDESKNPFADDVDSSSVKTKEIKAAEPSTNPFGECDE